MPDVLTDRIPPEYEVRAVAELRAGEPDDPPGTFTGYASVFWQVDDYLTAFAPKAFRKSIADRAGRVPMLWYHDPEKLIGPVIDLKEDKHGLAFKARAGATNWGAMLRDQLEMGLDHIGLSHGFRRLKDRSAEDGDPLDFAGLPAEFKGIKAEDVRVITEVSVVELSTLPHAFASNAATSVDSARNRAALADAAALASLTDALRAGRLTDDQRAQIVAAIEARDAAAAGIDHGTATPEPARPDFDLMARAAIVRARLALGLAA